ncbi:hypothetical protein L1987_28834 [Smallanthus sonchifolius]|uniref:Uncharacterized protein n=1 Tax=Smallanthus sonchifolius TaxID=185202 RepID=A0ACB9HZS7_9ASTR|nr:hypothetical protein L1987_28834 [Smallanthus sonchifolius]
MVMQSQNQNNPILTNKRAFKGIPVIDLSCPDDAKHLIVNACQDYGFFKVINHGVPLWLVSQLENETMGFFNMRQSEKDKYCPPNPLGYRSNTIGTNGDVGWIEYLLFTSNDFPTNSKTFSSVAKEYVEAVRKLGCEILELVAEGLKIEPKNVLSRMLSDEKADTVFRLNHYPPCPDHRPTTNGRNPIGFGEHTDPQLISIARSNTTSGLQICLSDGTWVPVPPDHTSFFINVDDLLQVMTNGRFKSVRHRVVTDKLKSRVSMIYFGGPPLMEKISPIGSLIEPGEESLYHEFTWFEYKSYGYKTKLADDRLSFFHKGSHPLSEKDKTVAKEYVEALRKLGCEILELVAEGLKIEPKNVLSRMLSDEKADTVFRLNHYPPCPDHRPTTNGRNPIGFGEHTDPQLISIARSNTTSGLQICLSDGTWVPVPPDHTSFFINVDDLLQVQKCKE